MQNPRSPAAPFREWPLQAGNRPHHQRLAHRSVTTWSALNWSACPHRCRAGCDDAVLERLLFPPSEPSSVQRPAPTWPTVHNELRRKGVTLELLWQEYKAEQPDGYQYSAFCQDYRCWRQQLTLSMR